MNMGKNICILLKSQKPKIKKLIVLDITSLDGPEFDRIIWDPTWANLTNYDDDPCAITTEAEMLYLLRLLNTSLQTIPELYFVQEWLNSFTVKMQHI